MPSSFLLFSLSLAAPKQMEVKEKAAENPYENSGRKISIK
jgi:hypothetical protein